MNSLSYWHKKGKFKTCQPRQYEVVLISPRSINSLITHSWNALCLSWRIFFRLPFIQSATTRDCWKIIQTFSDFSVWFCTYLINILSNEQMCSSNSPSNTLSSYWLFDTMHKFYTRYIFVHILWYLSKDDGSIGNPLINVDLVCPSYSEYASIDHRKCSDKEFKMILMCLWLSRYITFSYDTNIIQDIDFIILYYLPLIIFISSLFWLM